MNVNCILLLCTSVIPSLSSGKEKHCQYLCFVVLLVCQRAISLVNAPSFLTYIALNIVNRRAHALTFVVNSDGFLFHYNLTVTVTGKRITCVIN
jgi:hypothetical protein